LLRLNEKIIIILVFTVGILLGALIFRDNRLGGEISAKQFTPAGDGKLAKEYKRRELIGLIKENAKDIQKCYFEYLNGSPKISEGVLVILIKVEENGKISSMQVTKNEFKNEKMASCLEKKMTSYYLAPPPYGINRYISHSLAFKSEETAKREAEEMAKKNKPPKFLPLNIQK